TLWALALLIAGTVFGLVRLDRVEDCTGICLTIDVTTWEMPALRTVGEWVLPFAAVGSSLLIRLALRNSGARRNVGNLWDVMTFFPRRFHPFAVRPYAERAVPRLQRHIEAQPGPVLVSAHSQGTVLAFAALRGLAGRPVLRRVALVTYGSPLSRLHARFFPHYFNADEFKALHDELWAWRNFYRYTDHIGQKVFDEVADAAADDVVLADPAVAPPADDGSDLEPDPDPRRIVAGHNDYRRERDLKTWVRSTKERLEAEAPG
ncbi:MAG: alpha/beta hydrolase, partial [Actinomycetota bacterium]|nr:alpha/beta hydrolase [Actinomycetota bacterium]